MINVCAKNGRDSAQISIGNGVCEWAIIALCATLALGLSSNGGFYKAGQIIQNNYGPNEENDNAMSQTQKRIPTTKI